MKTLIIADDDSLVGGLQASAVDLLISLGDLWDRTILETSERHQAKRTFAVRGNHDSNAPFEDPIASLHLRVETHHGLRFGGFNGSWRYKPKGHHLFEQHEVRELLHDFPAVDVFVAHNSPRGFHQRDDDTHQGFDAFNEYIERNQPAYVLHGHQHLNQVSTIGRTTLIGVFGERILDIPDRTP